MDEKDKQEGIEGLLVIIGCAMFAVGAGLVTHSWGYGLMAFPVAYMMAAFVRMRI